MSPRDLRKDTIGIIGHLDSGNWPEAPAERGLIKDGSRHGWYLPDVNIYPRKQKVFEGDLVRLIRRWVQPGHAPASPLLGDTDAVVTLGSCFARELRLFLSLSGVPSSRFWIPSGLNNTFAILDFFSWCVTGAQTGRGYRYEESDARTIEEWTPAAEREAYVQSFAAAGAFVFTIGLAEVWQDRATGGVFWRGVPQDVFDAQRHVFRLTTVDENAQNLRQIVALVRRINAHAPIVLTLSPVPLVATHRDISCMTADCVSKSVLRVALDQVMAERMTGVYYWPSFEVVKWVGANLGFPAYGEGGKARDVNRLVVSAIIDAFVDAFYHPSAVALMRETRAKLQMKERLLAGSVGAGTSADEPADEPADEL
jgi:hypothetical protein